MPDNRDENTKEIDLEQDIQIKDIEEVEMEDLHVPGIDPEQPEEPGQSDEEKKKAAQEAFDREAERLLEQDERRSQHKEEAEAERRRRQEEKRRRREKAEDERLRKEEEKLLRKEEKQAAKAARLAEEEALLAENFDDLEDQEDQKSLKVRLRKRREKRRAELDAMDFQERIRHHRLRVKILVCSIVLVCVLLLVGAYLVRTNLPYTSYKVVSRWEQGENTYADYVGFYGKVLRFSKDGARYFENENKDIWNETYEMKAPMADTCRGYAVIAEKNGTHVCAFDLHGKIYSYDTVLPIQDAQISEIGTVALLLKDNNSHRIQYLDTTGSVVAEGKSVFSNGGYPLSMSLSDDGLKLAVSYLGIDEEGVSSRVEFFNFSSVGAERSDNIVSSQDYRETIVPKVHYANSGVAYVFGDDRFSVFRGSQTPELFAEVPLEEQVLSVFSDDRYAGMIFPSDNMEHTYRMDIYDGRGNKVSSEYFDFPYTQVFMDHGQVVLYSDKQWCIYNARGRQRLGPLDFKQPVKKVIPLSATRFILMGDAFSEVVDLR